MQICLWTFPQIAFAQWLSCWAVPCWGGNGWCLPHHRSLCWVSDRAPVVLVCLLWQEWSEAKDQLSFALSMGADAASRGSSHSETWEKMGIHILGTHAMGSPLAWCHMCHVLSCSCPHGLAGGSLSNAWWGCGVCISSSAWTLSLAVLQQSPAGLELLPTAM